MICLRVELSGEINKKGRRREEESTSDGGGSVWYRFWDRGRKEKVNMEVTGMHEKRSLYAEALKD